MQLTWQQTEHPKHIDAADQLGVLINEQRYQCSLLLTDSLLIADWPIKDCQQLSLESLQALLSESPEILLIGTGKQQVFPDMSLLQTLFQQGIGVEVMDTLAACRTFNVLLHEQRKVAAALIWEDE